MPRVNKGVLGQREDVFADPLDEPVSRGRVAGAANRTGKQRVACEHMPREMETHAVVRVTWHMENRCSQVAYPKNVPVPDRRGRVPHYRRLAREYRCPIARDRLLNALRVVVVAVGEED